MSNMFRDAPSFNQPITFDGQSLNATEFMFYGAAAFNSTHDHEYISLVADDGNVPRCNLVQPAVTFRTDSVTTLDSAFRGASNFNQAVNFTTTKVTSMWGMFANATNFNQPINFDGSSLNSTSSMFAFAASFNSSVNITNSSILQQTANMFLGASSFNNPTLLLQTDSGLDVRRRKQFQSDRGIEHRQRRQSKECLLVRHNSTRL